MSKLERYVLAAVFCILVGIVLVIYDLVLDLSVLYPVHYFGSLALVAVLGVACRRWIGGLGSISVLLVVAFAATVGATDHGRKKFMRDLSRVKIGMTRDEVEHHMGHWPRGTGWPGNPYGAGHTSSSSDTLVFRPGNPGDDSTWAIFSFHEDRVVRIQFDPD